MPDRRKIDRLSRTLPSLFSPGFKGPVATGPGFAARLKRQLRRFAEVLTKEVDHALRWAAGSTRTQEPLRARTEAIVAQVLNRFLEIVPVLEDDVRAAFENDPAASGYHEIVEGPGFDAICTYRVAHELQRCDVPILPRLLSYCAQARTGIDIHPEASIGRGFAIDHGTGVVIGQTAQIGEFVQLFQGVTLGATHFARNASGQLERGSTIKRHPTLCDRVKVFANACVFGGTTVIGHSTWIGANVRLYHSVGPEMLVRMDRSSVRVEPRVQRNALASTNSAATLQALPRLDSGNSKGYDFHDRYLESLHATEGCGCSGDADELDWPRRGN
jgi:serine O-acetyltransferase